MEVWNMGFFKRTRNQKRDSMPVRGSFRSKPPLTTEWWDNSYVIPHADVNLPNKARVMVGEQYVPGGLSGRSNGKLVSIHTTDESGMPQTLQYLVIGSVQT